MFGEGRDKDGACSGGKKGAGVGGGGVFLPARATYCMTGSDYGCAACAAVPARTDAAPRREALRLYASFHYRSSPRRCRPRSTSVLPQFPPPTHPRYFFSLAHILSASFTSLILLLLLLPPLSPFTPLPTTSAYSPLSHWRRLPAYLPLSSSALLRLP